MCICVAFSLRPAECPQIVLWNVRGLSGGQCSPQSHKKRPGCRWLRVCSVLHFLFRQFTRPPLHNPEIEFCAFDVLFEHGKLLRCLFQILKRFPPLRDLLIDTVKILLPFLDHAKGILDTLQGVQTPENVTQTREATALDNAILAAMNQNKNSATFEQTTESPMNGPVKSNAAEAGTSNINAASEKIKGDFDKLIEKNKGKLSFNQWVDYGNSLQGEDAAALNAFLNDIETGKTQYKYDAGGGVEQLPGELRKAGLTSKDKIRKWVSSALDEGKEEVVQGMIERLVNKAVYDQDAPWNDDTGKNEDAVFNFDQSLKEFGMGTAIGGILGGGQMLTQDIATRGQRLVDPTASPLDQAILDTLQGVQTPENVTQTREATALDNAILAAMNQNKNTSADVAEAQQKAELPKVSMEDFANNDSPIWRNVEYGDTDTKTSIMQQVHKDMVERGEVVHIPAETVDEVSQYFPDMRNVSKKERVPVLRQKMNELKGVNYEFEVDGNILDAKLYDTGIKEVMEKVTKDKGGMLLNSDQIFKNAQYLYSSPDYDGNSNVQRWNYFYTPIQAGDETLGVRIAVRDMKQTGVNPTNSQIYNWNIKKDATLGGGRSGETPLSSGTSSAASSNQNVAQAADSVNRENVGADASTGAAPAGFDPLSHASNQYGAIPPGENPSRVVDIPASMDGETKVSRFSRTAAEAQITTDEMVGRIEQLVQDGKLSHEVYSNKQAIEDGAKQIEKQYARGKTIEQIRSEFIRDANAGKAGAKFVSQGTTLYADAIAEGNYNAASDILVALTAVETNAGQTVQAARLMKSLTPEGRIFTVQKMVSNLEAQINQRRAANKQIEINVPDALLQTYQNAATADAQEAALQNIYQNVADQIPTSLGEAAQQWRYFSMLANPSTHAKNIMGIGDADFFTLKP